jgi:hypothetical protein
MMAACGIGYAAGTFLTGPACWEPLGISAAWVKGNWETFFFYPADPVTGLIIGISTGTLWRGWKAGILIRAAGSQIFAAGFWLNYTSWTLLFGRGEEKLVQSKIINAVAWNLVCWFIGYALFGGIAGLFWGFFWIASSGSG